MKTGASMIDRFTEMAKDYDEHNRRLASIADNLHFLIGLVLKELPARSRVLCAGVGTGAEILALSEVFPEWTFVGVDPSGGMLEVCRHRLAEAGILERCELVEGYVQDAPPGEAFDAALSIFVAHFVPREDRIPFYRGMVERLVPKGVLVDVAICQDLDAPEFPFLLKNWAAVQSTAATTPEGLANLESQLRGILTVVPPRETEDLLRRCGIAHPVRFFQAFLIGGWYGFKEPPPGPGFT